jgi:hypothetical protein
MPHRLARTGLILGAVALATAALLAVLPALAVLRPASTQGALRHLAAAPWPDAAALLLPYAVASLAFLELARFGLRLRRCGPFGQGAAAALGRFGIGIAGAALLLPVSRLVATGWAGIAAAPPVVLLAAASGIAIGLLVLACAAALAEGRRLADEVAGFV